MARSRLFDLFPPRLHLLDSPEIHICMGHVVQCFMVKVLVVVVDEFADRPLQHPRVEEIPQPDYVSYRLIEALNLALDHRMIGSASDVFDISGNAPTLEKHSMDG